MSLPWTTSNPLHMDLGMINTSLSPPLLNNDPPNLLLSIPLRLDTDKDTSLPLSAPRRLRVRGL